MKSPLRVLMVEDNPDDALLSVDELTQAGFDVTFERVDTAVAMRKALRSRSWDLVLADYALPDFSAAAALWLVKQAGYDLPFIIVSGTITDETAVAAMKAGAHDFVTKDHLARLAPAVHRELAEAARRRERVKLAEELQHDRFRTIIEKSADVIALLGPQGRICYVSPAVQGLLGYTPQEWSEHRLSEFVQPDTRAGFEADFARSCERGGSVVHARPRFQRKDATSAELVLVLTNLFHEPSVQAVVANLRQPDP